MFTNQPAAGSGDISFQIFGIPVRVTPWFWLTTALLGWNSCTTFDRLTHVERVEPRQLVVWVAAGFLSILIHELGHSWAFRYYGIGSHIILYQFGGVAIADAYSYSATRNGRHPLAQIVISAAGPGLQLASAIAILVAVRGAGYTMPLYGFAGRFLPNQLNGVAMDSLYLDWFCSDFIHVSVYWALLNLLPVYPLDGGQISRQVFILFDRGDSVKNSLMLSMVVAVFVALYGFSHHQQYLGMMFGLLAYSSYQALQPLIGGRPFNGNW